MKQISLKEYIEKLCVYNMNNRVISTFFKHYKTFTEKYELIKDNSVYIDSIGDTTKSIFNRYMNDDKWAW